MPSFRVVYPNNSVAKNIQVSISVDGGGVRKGITNNQGYVSIQTSGETGKIIINGTTQHIGSLNISEVVIR